MTPLNPDRNESDGSLPRDAWLMGYLDGELSQDECARVEAWLEQDPAARAELDEQRRIRELFEEGYVESPAARKWASALAGIESGLENAAVKRPRSWHLASWIAAAAVLIVAFWVGTHRPPLGNQFPDQGKTEGPVDEVYEVASESDVTIDDMDPFDGKFLVRGRVPSDVPADLLSAAPFEVADSEEVAVVTIDGGDVDLLVVCEPPVTGPLDMARRSEIRVDHIAPMGKEQRQPYLAGGNGMPMIMVPYKTARRD